MGLCRKKAFIIVFSALCVGVLGVVMLFLPRGAFAASFLLSPSSGTFTVGSTFDVAVLLDTQGKSVNALDVDLRFPSDKFQLVSPKTSVSVISVWTSQPQFNNKTGRVRLQGGIPRGVNLSNAVVATLTFRVKSVGSAILRFGDESKILLNDGLGTDDLSHRGDAVYSLVLPPPAGPIVVSETHPDQSQWYAVSTAILSWASDEHVQGYSYVLNAEPVSAIDDTNEGSRTSISYKNLPDGKFYFHIKALRDETWGGMTHFALKIDTTPPALYPLEIIPSFRTSTRDPVIKFVTTDELSGLDRYEMKIIPLKASRGMNAEGDQPFFIEVENPYISPTLPIGPYDIIVRAYDKAGNFQEVVKRLTITDKLFSVFDRDGVVLFGYVIPWLWVFVMFISIIIGLVFVGTAIRHWHNKLDTASARGAVTPSIERQLEELKGYKQKYGATVLLFFTLGTALLFPWFNVMAQRVELAPPYVTTVSRNVSNNEIFYIGGKTEDVGTQVIIYTQNLTSGETTSFVVNSDKNGEWFYRHNAFLSTGHYILWTQAKIGEELSPPSAQIDMKVGRAAIQFGVSRVSYEALYAGIMSFLLLIIIGFSLYLIIEYRRGKKKHLSLVKEFRDVEESVRRGFAVLRRDIEREIETIHKMKLTKGLAREEHEREAELLHDLKDIEQRIGKEIMDVEKLERI